MNYKCGACHVHVVDGSDSEWCPYCGTLYDPQGKPRKPAIGQDGLAKLAQHTGTHMRVDEAIELASRLWDFIAAKELVMDYHAHRRDREIEAAKQYKET